MTEASSNDRKNMSILWDMLSEYGPPPSGHAAFIGHNGDKVAFPGLTQDDWMTVIDLVSKRDGGLAPEDLLLDWFQNMGVGVIT